MTGFNPRQVKTGGGRGRSNDACCQKIYWTDVYVQQGGSAKAVCSQLRFYRLCGTWPESVNYLHNKGKNHIKTLFLNDSLTYWAKWTVINSKSLWQQAGSSDSWHHLVTSSVLRCSQSAGFVRQITFFKCHFIKIVNVIDQTCSLTFYKQTVLEEKGQVKNEEMWFSTFDQYNRNEHEWQQKSNWRSALTLESGAATLRFDFTSLFRTHGCTDGTRTGQDGEAEEGGWKAVKLV